MGACLEPTPDMTPWYAVEMHTGAADLTAAVYLRAQYRAKDGDGDLTDADHAAAWRTTGDRTFIAPGTPAALLATLDQIAGHPAYTRWLDSGGEPAFDSVRASLVDGHAVLDVPTVEVHPQRPETCHTVLVLGFRHVAPLRDAIRPLVDPAAFPPDPAATVARRTHGERIDVDLFGEADLAADLGDGLEIVRADRVRLSYWGSDLAAVHVLTGIDDEHPVPGRPKDWPAWLRRLVDEHRPAA
jgi:hypothetical protein